MNAVMFNIGMFSYMCMAMIPIFSKPNWPKRIIAKMPWFIKIFLPSCDPSQTNPECSNDVGPINENNGASKNPKEDSWRFTLKKAFKCSFFTFYIVLQLVLPFSHSITKVILLFSHSITKVIL